MIYLVSKQTQLFDSKLYQYLSEEESVKMVKSFDVIQLDTETLGRDPHLVPILTLQMGNDAKDARIVVDATTVDITIYKEVLESKLCIGHNLKFDIGMLFKHKIILTKVFDTMIVEQLLHLGYDNKFFRYNLHDVAARYLPGVDLDKSVRGEIIWRGLDDRTILYAANDVVYLEQIMDLEIEACKKANCIQGMNLENAFVPVIAYLEWCGIHLDVNKWMQKMENDKNNAKAAEEALNNWIRKQAETDPFYRKYIDPQLDLFETTRKVLINWSSSQQLLPIFQHLGFDTKSRDKKTGETKESITEKVLATQKKVNPEFWRLFFGEGNPESKDFFAGYQGATKVVSTYGQSYLNAINPYTGRIHTNFKQLGAASGRMACGNKQKNTDLSKVNHCEAGYPQCWGAL
jgi:DNA polymerase I-like protein with 3'-5' exonuclease and polymerase domains